MAALARMGRRWLRRPPSPPRRPPSSGFPVLDMNQKIEEENLAWYNPTRFYPVRIGEVFKSRYQVLGKLGYGAYSTVWLCRDLVGHEYVTLKVCERNAIQATREVVVYEHLNAITTSHAGSKLVRTMLDAFQVAGSDGCHQCLVHKPLGMSLSQLRARCLNRKLPEQLLQLTLMHIFLALDFLHTEARVIHTDLQQNNILLAIEDETILSDFEKAEWDAPSPRKTDGGRITHTSRELGVPRRNGRPILCDFGEARLGEGDYDDDIQPYLYRAPEVILQMRWNNKVDIWNVGVMVWDLFENKHMFDARDENQENSSLYHLAEMVALLGPPPRDFLQRSDITSEYFDQNGKRLNSSIELLEEMCLAGFVFAEALMRFQGQWKGAAGIPEISLEASEENLEGQRKALFLQFMRKMLQWVPEKRQSAKQLLDDPWLKSSASC